MRALELRLVSAKKKLLNKKKSSQFDLVLICNSVSCAGSRDRSASDTEFFHGSWFGRVFFAGRWGRCGLDIEILRRKALEPLELTAKVELSSRPGDKGN